MFAYGIGVIMPCKGSADLVAAMQRILISNCVILVVLFGPNLPVSESEGISPERCIVWGPGLDPDAVLPVRYFFIQAVSPEGRNLTLSPGKHPEYPPLCLLCLC